MSHSNRDQQLSLSSKTHCGIMSVNVVDSKQSHTKCTDMSKKFAASIYWVEEKAVLEKSDQDVQPLKDQLYKKAW